MMCTHLLLEAEGLADQVVVLEAGHDVIYGRPPSSPAATGPTPSCASRRACLTHCSACGATPGVLGVDLDEDGRVRCVSTTSSACPIWSTRSWPRACG